MPYEVGKKQLNRAQWSKDETLKSCASGSKDNGKEHGSFRYSQYFGTTPVRSPSDRPNDR